METAISLGWNCLPAIKGIHLGLRQTKANGYKTCPFDIGFTNYEGVMLCLEEDFKYFYDTKYLKVIPAPFSTPPFEKDTPLIYNTRYNFIFNHESSTPDNGNLYLIEKWSGGKTHFIDNNFEKFIERYARRIDNFRNYLNNDNKITFIISKIDSDTSELSNIIKQKYPNCKFEILFYKEQEFSEENFENLNKLMKQHSI
jgi:hypothetical protein